MIRSKAERFGTSPHGSFMPTCTNALRSGAWKWLRLAGLLTGLTAAVIILALLANSRSSSIVLAGGTGSRFQVLGPMPGAFDGGFTFASALSADGSTIVGQAYVCPGGGTSCNSTGTTEAFRWTLAGGYEPLGALDSSSPDPSGSAAYAVSSDGSVVVGFAPLPPPQGTNGFGAFRWTAAQGMQPLPDAPINGTPPMQQAFGVSADGSMIAGEFGWFNNTTGQSGTFGTFPGQTGLPTALGVSGNGQVVVGYAVNGSNGGGPTNNAFRWTLANGLQDIGVPGGVNSDADAISGDGTVIVGEFEVPLVNFPALGYHAFRWTASTGMVDLGTLGGPESRAIAVNQDGSVIVGTSFTSQASTSNHAFRWTAQTGMQDLGKLVGTGSFTPTFATGVSADGTVIAGYGNARVGKLTFLVEPFRAVVPLP